MLRGTSRMWVNVGECTKINCTWRLGAIQYIKDALGIWKRFLFHRCAWGGVLATRPVPNRLCLHTQRGAFVDRTCLMLRPCLKILHASEGRILESRGTVCKDMRRDLKLEGLDWHTNRAVRGVHVLDVQFSGSQRPSQPWAYAQERLCSESRDVSSLNS